MCAGAEANMKRARLIHLGNDVIKSLDLSADRHAHVFVARFPPSFRLQIKERPRTSMAQDPSRRERGHWFAVDVPVAATTWTARPRVAFVVICNLRRPRSRVENDPAT